jgi:hypothetical protein
MSDIFHLFSHLENKINAYHKLSNLVTCNEKHIKTELSKIVEFGVIEDYVFRIDHSESLKYLNFLKTEVEKLLFNDALILRIAKHDDIELEFGNIESAASRIKLELNSHYNKLNEYIKYIKSKEDFLIPQVDDKKIDDVKIYEFKESIVKNLASLELENTSVFDKTNYDILIKNIGYFIGGQFESITPKLNFCVTEKNYAYYLIQSIQNHSSFSLNKINNISINQANFIAGNCSKAMVAINKKERKATKKTRAFFAAKAIIDSLIKDNRKEIK